MKSLDIDRLVIEAFVLDRVDEGIRSELCVVRCCCALQLHLSFWRTMPWDNSHLSSRFIIMKLLIINLMVYSRRNACKEYVIAVCGSGAEVANWEHQFSLIHEIPSSAQSQPGTLLIMLKLWLVALLRCEFLI